ncbi:hypothetical protein K435DRAFT_680790 [Dendrothele bispora CBS 962.96]|uniref:Uncharacterized protein n=1 Tax=Dendrothele bispora (strain CBS 962.96) TaxID=1314807 RepID=A0A4S8LGC2_DENBC|nr:hypothetical protein K435DRAFT_680790 [Dendrothele bispora CBS 962.96]
MDTFNIHGSTFDPFWSKFPSLCDIHCSITPDILHQLYQGVLKHLVSWVQEVMTPAELDRKIRSLPPTFGVRHFKNGISALKQISGRERKEIGKILLACLAPEMTGEGAKACRAILDFIYMAQYESHDDQTLKYMEDALKQWHENRDYFMQKEVRDDFNIPKFHSLIHYVEAIKRFGATDNYNTELFERLHIDFTKLGWRASNKRDHFPQMVKWISRREKVAMFDYSLTEMSWATESDVDSLGSSEKSGNTFTYTIAKHPTESNKPLEMILDTHFIPQFLNRLKEFLNALLPPTQRQGNHALIRNSPIPILALDVWHSFKIQSESPGDGGMIQEIVKAIPNKSKGLETKRFDTVVVMATNDAESVSLEGESHCQLENFTMH